jgi:hypothetical protein
MKIQTEDLEIGDFVWMPEFEEYAEIIFITINLNKKWVITLKTFSFEKTMIFDNRRKFELL